MEQPNNSVTPQWEPSRRWVPAFILIAIGAIFLLNNLHIFYIDDLVRYWPVAMIAYGVFRLVDSHYPGGHVSGGFLIVFGGAILAINLGYLAMRWQDLWPLALIAFGLMMLTSRLSPRMCRPRWGRRHWNEDWNGRSLREASVFGGGKRVITDQNFNGGKVDAVFSGWEIDLRGASMAGDSAVLDVSAVFGGVEIKIPLTWNAVVRGAGVFGAYVDNTRHPNPAETPNIKTLVLKGGAVFGGVEVKN